MRLSLRTAGRIAWRETRSSVTKFLFVVFAVAIGVGALAGVRGFSDSVRAMLNSESRTIMAADLSARQFAPPKADQLVQLDRLGSQGVDHTLITETVSMAAATTPDATPALVSIKAVDPGKYPYYGTVKLSPDMPLAQALTPDTVIAGEDVLIRLGVKVGEHVHLGSGRLYDGRDQFSPSPTACPGASECLGLRMMISREGFERTGLMQLGEAAQPNVTCSRSEPNGPSMDDVRAAILDALPEARVIDSRESNPLITRGLDQGHHVPQPDQPDRADRRRDRRRHGHVRPPPAEDGQHRCHEVAGSHVWRTHPHLHYSDPDAGPAGRDRGRRAPGTRR